MNNNPTKYIVILGDGMADYPDESGQTPLSIAVKPMADSLAQKSLCGMCQTIPAGMKPGSDTANLSVMGYDPNVYYTGRSPLEALSIGINLEDTDVTYRCNLVTLSADEAYENKTMIDYSSGEITTAEANTLIKYLAAHLTLDGMTLYSGISYRHCLVRKDGELGAQLTPPHDISDKQITSHLPTGSYSAQIISLMKQSYDLLITHPINLDRVKRGLRPANSIWLWGEGKKPLLTAFESKFGLKGAVISAVDLLKGIGIGAKMTSIDVEGATGNIDTNFEGKAIAAIEALETHDFVYVHIEAPDECGHQGDRAGKIKSIELIDEKIITPIVNYCEFMEMPIRLLFIPDHATPLRLKTHTSDPVPFMLYDSTKSVKGVDSYAEANCASGLLVAKGYEMMNLLLRK